MRKSITNEVITNRVELRKKGITVLQKELGIQGFIEFMREFGLNAGDYTSDREQWLNEKSVDEVVHKIKKTI